MIPELSAVSYVDKMLISTLSICKDHLIFVTIILAGSVRATKVEHGRAAQIYKGVRSDRYPHSFLDLFQYENSHMIVYQNVTITLAM